MLYWNFASVAAKLAGLIAMAGVVGGGFCLYLAPSVERPLRRRILAYILACAVAGLLAAGLFFLIQIGAINRSGLRGMWDTQMGMILADSGLGHSLGLRLLGFLAAIGMLAVLWRREDSGRDASHGLSAALLFVASVILLGLSFSLTGHVATLGSTARTAIVLHVLGVLLWIGALYPLWLLCEMDSTGKLQGIMRRFGKLAVFIVALLILSGIYLLIELLDSFSAFAETRYGQSLLFKLLGVTGLLTLAALNKLVLVPALGSKGPAAGLKRSIFLEMGFALAILIVTAYLTTVVELPQG